MWIKIAVRQRMSTWPEGSEDATIHEGVLPMWYISAALHSPILPLEVCVEGGGKAGCR